MPIFDAIGIAGTGVTVNRKWMDAVSDNIANINTVRPATRSRSAPATSSRRPSTRRGRQGGVQVAGIARQRRGPDGLRPEHPLADAQGYVRYPTSTWASQMTS